LWLVVVTGVRRGELCGLQIRDIDLDRGLVHVAFNYVVRGGQRVHKDTKTHQDRWLAIDPDTSELIATYLDEIRAERGWRDNTPAVRRPGPRGRPARRGLPCKANRRIRRPDRLMLA
jgi:integrase